MSRIALVAAFLAAVYLSGCSGNHHKEHDVVLRDRTVSIEIEVYDPVTGYVWQDVSVRILEVEHEWSNCICPNPVRNDFYYTDEFGIVYYSPQLLGDSNLGFLVDSDGRAVLPEYEFEDEASVLIEVSAPGFGEVYERVDLSWDQPDVFIQIPF